MIRKRKCKVLHFTREEFNKNKDKIMSLAYGKHEGYDSCWVYIKGDDNANACGFGTCHGAPIETSFDFFIKNREEVLDALLNYGEVSIVDEHGCHLFTITS